MANQDLLSNNTEAELETIEITSRNVNRTEYAIAQFVDGYAAGWSFAVSESFREALDIKLSDKRINKKTFRVWTQVWALSFKEGDTFYNHMSAHSNWEEFLQGHHSICVQVQSATPSGYIPSQTIEVRGDRAASIHYHDRRGNKQIAVFRVSEQRFTPGEVTIQILQPNAAKTDIQEVSIIRLKQGDFVSLLQTGQYYDTEQEKYVSLRYDRDGE